MDEKLIARFWKKVDRKGPDECWLWTRATVLGYGVIKQPGVKKLLYAHRIAVELDRGPMPVLPGSHGAVVMHACDVRYPKGDLTYRRCCNPAHLDVGTQADNLRDMIAKGRHGGGGKKVSDEAVVTYRRRYASGGVLQKDLADEAGISNQQMSDILNGKSRRVVLTLKDTAVQD